MNEELNIETGAELPNSGNENQVITPQAEEATATEEQPAANGYEKRISTLTARNFHKDQELAQLKAENETLKALKAAKAAEAEGAVIPEFPSDDLRYDDANEYQKKVSEYHRAVASNAVAQAEKKRDADLAELERNKAEQARVGRQQDIVTGYVDGGIKSGISEVKMQANEQVLAQHRISPDLAEFIYSDADGARIVDYLADNPEKLQDLVGSSGGHAYIKLANEIKPAALSTKPAHTNAPDPISPTRGAGSTPTSGINPILAGATFE